MAQAPAPAAIRNIAIVGHSSAGKTTLVEAILFRSGVIPRQGSIDDGTTVCDYEPEEIARKISVGLSSATVEWKTPTGPVSITMLDAPGYADFEGGLDAALSVADLAVIVVSAVDGVQSGTEEAWRLAEAAGVPRLIVVNKEDRPRADFRGVLNQLHEVFGTSVVALGLPLGEEESFAGFADILAGKAYRYGPDGKATEEEIPADLQDEVAELRDAMVEEIVTHDDDMMERYLGGDEPSQQELETMLAREVQDGEAVPVLLCSAVTGVGVDRVADLICALGPSPVTRPSKVQVTGAKQDPDAEPETIEIDADPAGDPLLYVFRTVVDQFGQVSMFKVLSGTVTSNAKLSVTTGGGEERLHGFFQLRGREHVPLEQVSAGQIAAVVKLAHTHTGDLLAGGKSAPVRAVPLPERPPVYRLALKPVTQADDDKLSSALARLSIEDPTLKADLSGHQPVLGGLGDTHLAVALDRLARGGVHVETEPVQIAYRETIGRQVEVEGKIKKQSGGHGQFAVVQLRVSPLGRGSGFEFADVTVGGSVPRNYIPAVEKGIVDTMAAGGVYGYEIVDLRVEVYDGKAHPVDSSDMAFRTAAGTGVKEALAKAGSVVLEPVCAISVVVPTGNQGDVMGDLSTRRGRITQTTSIGDRYAQVDAMVPAAELSRYVLDLRSITGGRGAFTMKFDHYEVMPGVPPQAPGK